MGDSMTLTDDDLRLVGAWAADCAERVLPLFAAKARGDARPQAALDGVREYAQGGKRTAELRRVAWAALAAAREVGDSAAEAAARAAGLAAATAYTHALATVEQAKHLLGPPAYAALARERAADGDPAAGVAEIRWALAHASASVRAVARRFPARGPGRGRLIALMYLLDAGLRQ